MKTSLVVIGTLSVVALSLVLGNVARAGDARAKALRWDAELKEVTPKGGETKANYTFVATNVSKSAVSITKVLPTCGCTTAELKTPYDLAPGSNVMLKVAMDLGARIGAVTKTLRVETSAGTELLLIRANMPAK